MTTLGVRKGGDEELSERKRKRNKAEVLPSFSLSNDDFSY